MAHPAAPDQERASNRPVRIGVTGIGIMGSNHARVLAELPGAELVAVADPDQAQAQRVANFLGCKAVGDHHELLALGLDAVVVAAPTHLHHPIALDVIAAGCSVLVEKPVASTTEEGREIVAAAREKGVTLMIGHVERFNPAVRAIKDAIRDENLLSIAITRVGPFPPRMSNVGVVIDLAVHDIDLIRWFTGSDILEVQPQTRAAIAEREDIALLQFRTATGALAHINTNWLTPFKARTVHVATSKKYVIGDLLTRQVTEHFDYRPDGSYSTRHLPVAYAEPLRAELENFLSAVRTGRPPEVTGEEGVASLEIAIACLPGAAASARASSTKRRAVG
ncbi:Gfo/Idh/MocA family oxidoreductase [Xanthobacter sp.]|uniref:Gfo/Idh/MocA family protein n=1 Tax=Xanthobacter sp. TaxID=35809 RepID=UPI0025FD54EB|nr:Gfo/Idh/MocA family oxidoreductase [Xanthobacter sp.]